ncbi:MAG: oxidoreductase [Planctomycetaceae bacterium]|nr:oxidoreductase [Planctomycetaceae bacterium]|tara:strand:- start:5683 stop:6966 length:1284 start_codon:yes stop_codon:yes gene_type:complete
MTHQTRRSFLATTGALAATPYIFQNGDALGQENSSANDKLGIGCIGLGGRGSGIARQALKLGTPVIACDVDKSRAEGFAKGSANNVPAVQDYRHVLDNKDVDIVTIGTPDHWHSKIAIDAMRAGKDVYCEKPLTLTVDEGIRICEVVKETGKVFQVGTQQRSEYGGSFLQAVAICHLGWLGDKLKALSSVGTARQGGPFTPAEPPANLDWNMWLGQAPETEYIKERTHYQFRWWLEYSGGQVTDWGVHHTDIAMWALGLHETGPVSIEGKGTFDKRPNCYNVAHTFDSLMTFKNGSSINLTSGKNELIIEGSKGKIRVNRGGITGQIVDDIKADKNMQEQLSAKIEEIYRGKVTPHMVNFFNCVKSRELPISDVFTHHRSVSVCHLANIAMQLGRKLNFDPNAQKFEGDDQANSMLRRKQRKGFKIT